MLLATNHTTSVYKWPQPSLSIHFPLNLSQNKPDQQNPSTAHFSASEQLLIPNNLSENFTFGKVFMVMVRWWCIWVKWEMHCTYTELWGSLACWRSPLLSWLPSTYSYRCCVALLPAEPNCVCSGSPRTTYFALLTHSVKHRNWLEHTQDID
jgi:hypothetical protein